MKAFFKTLLVVIFTLGVVAILFAYYPYIFARTVKGVISDVQRVAMPVAVMSGSNASARELFSFAVGIKDESGEIVTASSEDRQWAVAKPGQCAEAKFYPYPPWEFDKSGTYFGARLIRLHVCDSGQIVSQPPASEVPAIPLESAATSPTEPTQQEIDAATAATAAAAAMSAPSPAPQGH